jgi:hypothetical protein
MKFCLSLAALLLFSALCGQSLTMDPETGKYVSKSVLQFNSISKDSLFDLTLKWLQQRKYVRTTGNKGIDVINKSSRLIVINQYFVPQSVPASANPRINFRLIFEFKDGKIRYTFTDFAYRTYHVKYEFEGEYFTWNKHHEKKLQEFIQESDAYIAGSTTELTEFVLEARKDDW